MANKDYFWLCRDSEGSTETYYKYYITKPSKALLCCSRWREYTDLILPEEFHSMTTIHLKPGEGPVKVRLVLADGGKGDG